MLKITKVKAVHIVCSYINKVQVRTLSLRLLVSNPPSALGLAAMEAGKWQPPHCPRKGSTTSLLPQGTFILPNPRCLKFNKGALDTRSDPRESAKQGDQAGALENMKFIHLCQINKFMSPQTYKK